MESSGDGLSWADQWDYKMNDKERAEQMKMDKRRNKESSSSSNKGAKIKAAASQGMDKAKIAAAASANKIKAGTSTGILWIKDQYHKRKTAKS